MTGGRIKGFDGLRALGMLVVFLTHRTTFVHDLEIGSAALWMFFVLSGFLIIGILHKERLRIEAGTQTFRPALAGYLVRRMRRIFPVYYLALFLLVPPLVAYGVIELDRHGYAMMLAYLTNIWIGTELLRWPSFIGHFWSLAIEEQFYLIAPFLALLIPARHLRAACIAIVIAGIATRVWMTIEGVPNIAIHTNSLVNFAFIAFGGVCRLSIGAARPGRASALILATMGGFVVLNFVGGVFDLPRAVVHATPFLVGIGLIAMTHNQLSPIVAALEWAPLVWFGNLSYGFYVYHNLIGLNTLVPLLQAWGFDVALPQTGAALISFVMALAAAWASWRLIEAPLMRGGRAPLLAAAVKEAPAARA